MVILILICEYAKYSPKLYTNELHPKSLFSVLNGFSKRLLLGADNNIPHATRACTHTKTKKKQKQKQKKTNV